MSAPTSTSLTPMFKWLSSQAAPSGTLCQPTFNRGLFAAVILFFFLICFSAGIHLFPCNFRGALLFVVIIVIQTMRQAENNTKKQSSSYN